MKNIADQTIELLTLSWGIKPKTKIRMVQDIIEVDSVPVGVFRKDHWRYCQNTHGNQWIELSVFSALVYRYEQEKRK